MSGLSSLLYIGASGLNASQQGVNTTADNVANVDTPGFRRREVELRSRPTYSSGGLNQGAGVEAAGTQRVVDEFLDQRVRDAGIELGYSSARSDALIQAEAIFADLEGYGVTGAMDEFFGSFDQLAAEPQDSGARQRVLESAARLTEAVNFVAAEVETQQFELERRVDDQVAQINELSDEVADLNLRIGGLETPPPDLLDRRDEALKELGELVGISVLETDGRVSVSLRGSGFGLVTDGVSRALSAEVVNGDVVVSGQRAGATEVLTPSLSGGRLTGTIAARDVDLEAVASGLDQFAFDFAAAVNTVHQAGFGTDGVGARDFFAPIAAVDGAAGAFTLDAGIVGEPDRIAAAQDALLVPGDNRNALTLAELRQANLPGGETPSATLRTVVADLGARVSDATTSVEAQGAVKARLDDLMSSMSGVSLDEEMTKLLQFRQSYAAAARIIQTADELMQEVIALKQ